jgi:hypothetical protein
MVNKLFSGDTLAKIIYFKDRDDALFDPDSATIDILDPDGTGLGTPLNLGDLTKTAVGTYELFWNIPSTGYIGICKIEVTANVTVGSLSNKEQIPFTVYE